MSHAPAPRIHPTALISPEAVLADDVQVGAYVIIEGEVHIGPGCVLRPHVHLCGPLSLGRNNTLFTGVVLGERPQHMKYADEPTRLEVGDNNVFREHVTVHRGTTAKVLTRIGNHNYFMVNSHIGHDCDIGNSCIFANGALVGGHCVIGDGVYLSGNAAVHQFSRLGRLALLSGVSATTKDVPPFMMQQYINCVVGVNVVGMRRAGLTPEQINAVRRAFHILYRERRQISAAADQIERELGEVDTARELVAFLRGSGRGISLNHDRANREGSREAAA